MNKQKIISLSLVGTIGLGSCVQAMAVQTSNLPTDESIFGISLGSSQSNMATAEKQAVSEDIVVVLGKAIVECDEAKAAFKAAKAEYEGTMKAYNKAKTEYEVAVKASSEARAVYEQTERWYKVNNKKNKANNKKNGNVELRLRRKALWDRICIENKVKGILENNKKVFEEAERNLKEKQAIYKKAEEEVKKAKKVLYAQPYFSTQVTENDFGNSQSDDEERKIVYETYKKLKKILITYNKVYNVYLQKNIEYQEAVKEKEEIIKKYDEVHREYLLKHIKLEEADEDCKAKEWERNKTQIEYEVEKELYEEDDKKVPCEKLIKLENELKERIIQEEKAKEVYNEVKTEFEQGCEARKAALKEYRKMERSSKYQVLEEEVGKLANKVKQKEELYRKTKLIAQQAAKAVYEAADNNQAEVDAGEADDDDDNQAEAGTGAAEKEDDNQANEE